MTLTSDKRPTIGLIEVPATGLYDAEGKNWTSLYRHRSLISKQVLIPDLQAGGFDALVLWLISPQNVPFLDGKPTRSCYRGKSIVH